MNKTLSFENIKKEISYLQKLFIEKIITDIWKENLNNYNFEDYNIEHSIDDYFEIGDYLVSFQDFEFIAEYKIPRTICYEFWDFKSGSYGTSRMKEFDRQYKNGNLRTFYQVYNNL